MNLDVEVAPFSETDISINAVEMTLSEGLIENLCAAETMQLPKRFRPKDNVGFLFRLALTHPKSSVANFRALSKTLDLTIKATVEFSDKCRPRIKMCMGIEVDFSTSINMNYGIPRQYLLRNSRLSSVPTSTKTGSSENLTPESNISESSGIHSNRPQTISMDDLGVTINFTAPSEVQVGIPFSWDVLVVNKSAKSRKLVITVLPKRRKRDGKGHLGKISSSSTEPEEAELADAIIDEKFLYAVQKNAYDESPQVVCLSTDIKIGSVNFPISHIMRYIWVTDATF